MPRPLTSLVPPRARRILARAVAFPSALLAALAVACSGGDEPTGPAGGKTPVARVLLAATHDTIETGERRTIGFRVLDARGNDIEGRHVEWSSTDPNVVYVIDASGLVAGVMPGTARVEAEVEVCRASVEITVVQAPVARVDVFGVMPQSWLGEGARVLAYAWSTRHTHVPDVAFTYGSSDTTIATVSPAGDVALLDTGTVTFTARAGDVAGSVTTVVGPPRVIRLTVARRAPWLLIGGSDTIAVTTYGYGDKLLTSRGLTYLSNDPSVLTVDSLGVMTAHAPGVGEVTVRSGQASASLRIAVLPEEPVELVVAPSRRVIAPRELARTGARLRGASGALMDNAALYATYESSDPDVAFLGLDGTRVYANRPGEAEIRIRAGHLVGSVTLVVEEASADGLVVDIIPVGATSEAVTAAAQRAARRWARVVKGGPMPQPLALPAGECGTWTSTIDRTVDGIAIFVQVERIDGPGGTLALAGPCALRGYGDHFPVVGVVSVDADDVSLMSQYGLMDDLMMHEIGHVLGIGTVWNLPEVRELVPEGADPRFTGAAARDAALRFGFLDAGERGVPVEVEGGDGTAGAHWRESIFGSELMTGWLDQGSNVLGAFTLGALADLGYEVHEAEVGDLIGLPRLDAAPFDWRDPTPTARRERHPARRIRMADRLVQPHLHVDRYGRVTPVEGRTRR